MQPQKKLGLFGEANRLVTSTLKSSTNTVVAGFKSIEYSAEAITFNSMQMRDESASEYLLARKSLISQLSSSGLTSEEINQYLSK